MRPSKPGWEIFMLRNFGRSVYCSLYLKTKDPKALKEAISVNRVATRDLDRPRGCCRRAFIAKDVTYGPDYYQRGNWLDRGAAMDDDIADLEKLLNQPPSGRRWRRWIWKKSSTRCAKRARANWVGKLMTTLIRSSMDFTRHRHPSDAEHLWRFQSKLRH